MYCLHITRYRTMKSYGCKKWWWCNQCEKYPQQLLVTFCNLKRIQYNIRKETYNICLSRILKGCQNHMTPWGTCTLLGYKEMSKLNWGSIYCECSYFLFSAMFQSVSSEKRKIPFLVTKRGRKSNPMKFSDPRSRNYG